MQFLKVLDQANIQIEIWERGAGYTLASGNDSSAAAAVAHKLNLVDRSVSIYVPGSIIQIEIGFGNQFSIRMTGGVAKVSAGVIDPELFAGLIIFWPDSQNERAFIPHRHPVILSQSRGG